MSPGHGGDQEHQARGYLWKTTGMTLGGRTRDMRSQRELSQGWVPQELPSPSRAEDSLSRFSGGLDGTAVMGLVRRGHRKEAWDPTALVGVRRRQRPR